MSETNPSKTIPVNGYDFARAIIEQKGDEAIEILLSCAKNTECDWLEKKASVYRSVEHDDDFRIALEKCPPDVREQRKDELNIELLATIACSIVALHNSRGGVLLIGIDDKTNIPVSFEDNDGGKIWKENEKGDYYLKAVHNRLIRENGEFKCGKKTYAIPVKDVGLIPKWCRYKGADVLALLVTSLPPEKAPLIVQEISNNSLRPYPPNRTPGDVGQVEKGRYSGKWSGSVSELADYHQRRQECFLNRDDLSFMLRNLGISTFSYSALPAKDVFSSVRRPGATHFVGRGKELTKLHDLLQSGRIPIVTGPGGTGKSELVFQYAEQHKQDYPGGLFQIDMATAKGWDDALRPDLWRSSAEGESMLQVLGLENENKDVGGFSTGPSNQVPLSEKVLQALRQRAKKEGDILLVLDNVESTKAFFKELTLEKLNLPKGAHMLATARSSDWTFYDSAVELPLPDLSLDEALVFLLQKRPAKSSAERQAAEEVARLLDCRVLLLRAIPALLDDPYSPLAGSYVELEAALRKDLLETVDGAMEENGEEGRKPSVLWTMTRETLLRHPAGASWVRLAHIASFFSPDGFRLAILRYLWGAIAAPDANTDGAFDQALDVLRRHGILSTDEVTVQIHRVMAAVLRRSAKQADTEIETSIGKVLADFDGMSPNDWIALSDNIAIVKFAPRSTLLTTLLTNDEFFDASVQVRILVKNPKFQIAVLWEELFGSDWVTVLSKHPEFAGKCDWGKLNGWVWANILCEQPQFSAQCPWEKLDGENWATLLCKQPQFSAQCPWEKLDGENWANLICFQPQFANECPWEKLTGPNWAILLSGQPQFAERCPWRMLEGFDWALLLSCQPQFAEHCLWDQLDNWHWIYLLEIKTQFSAQCPWEKFDGADWADLLCKQPQFSDKCLWKKLDGRDWSNLLCQQPQFSAQCAWEKFDGADWATLLCKQPQFSAQCPWEKLDGENWAQLIGGQPTFADRCPWGMLNGQAWSLLLRFQPQFFAQCPWEKFDGRAWVELIESQPQFSAHCPWEKLNGQDWANLLLSQPFFADCCLWEKLNEHDWGKLLIPQPQFAKFCPWEGLDWKKLDGEEWSFLLSCHPQFADYCPWDELEGEDWAWLLVKQPQFADRCQWGKLSDDNWNIFAKVKPEMLSFRPKAIST